MRSSSCPSTAPDGASRRSHLRSAGRDARLRADAPAARHAPRAVRSHRDRLGARALSPTRRRSRRWSTACCWWFARGSRPSRRSRARSRSLRLLEAAGAGLNESGAPVDAPYGCGRVARPDARRGLVAMLTPGSGYHAAVQAVPSPLAASPYSASRSCSSSARLLLAARLFGRRRRSRPWRGGSCSRADCASSASTTTISTTSRWCIPTANWSSACCRPAARRRSCSPRSTSSFPRCRHRRRLLPVAGAVRLLAHRWPGASLFNRRHPRAAAGRAHPDRRHRRDRAEGVARQIFQQHDFAYHVVGFIDDEPARLSAAGITR